LYFLRMRNVATLYTAPDKPPPVTRPLFLSLVVAGFPSPADDYLDRDLDLHELLIQHPAATYYVRLSGDSMKGAGLYDGDILVVDRSLEPKHNDIVIACPTQHPVEGPSSLSNVKWMPAYSRETGLVGDEALRLGYLA
jgi:SOS-response transcriptional repressor LexA